jgi:adenylate cyclase
LRLKNSSFVIREDMMPLIRVSLRAVGAMLNALFDAQAKAIVGHGGEILKFIGDGLLSIFPIDSTNKARAAARGALAAAIEAVEAVRRLTNDPSLTSEPPFEIVVALHIGTAIYGNVGAADRLDFTVIGPAVNLVSRIEAVAKKLKLPDCSERRFCTRLRWHAAATRTSSTSWSCHAT